MPAGMLPDHDMATPALTLLESDVKRMNMLPDVAVWIAGMAAPLNLPSSAPVADVPS